MPKRSISVHLALMFALSALLIVSVIGILLRSSLHDSLQKQMHNELLFRESLMSPWITARTSADGWSTLANKFSVLTNSEGERVRYWIVSDNPRFSMGEHRRWAFSGLLCRRALIKYRAHRKAHAHCFC